MVFRTGGGAPLLTLELPVTVPDWDRAPRLEFEFGFSTEEPLAPGTLFDSFSVTLQNVDGTATALLLTSDREGTAWAPETPGGFTIEGVELSYESVPFADLDPELSLQSAFSVGYVLPPAFAGQSATVYFDLFENANEYASMAYFTGVQISSLAITNEPTFLKLESSASLDEPFAGELGVSVDFELRQVTVPFERGNRFYRLSSDIRSRLRSPELVGDRWQFGYYFDPASLVLQGADQPGGPYQDEPDVVVDLPGQRLILSEPARPRYYRLRTEGPVEIVDLTSVDGQLHLHYRFAPQQVVLESSGRVEGPYEVEHLSSRDPEAMTISIPRLGPSRFFRIESDVELRIVDLQITSEGLVLTYE